MIKYNWVCTACGVTNPAGTEICAACGSDAVVSASAIQKHTTGPDEVPASTPQADGHRFLFFLVSCLVTGAGVLMLLLAPRQTGEWYLWIALLLILVGSNVVVALIKWCMRHLTSASSGRDN